MVLQRLLLLLPEVSPISGGWLWFAVLGGAGLLLWLAGARVSRSLLTLVFVAAGALLGKHLPGWASLKLDPMAGAIVGAAALGFGAYVFHRWIVGLGLGLTLALWTVLGCWVTAKTPLHWQWPPRPATWAEWETAATAVRTALGSDLVQQMAGLGGLALITGLGISILFPRVAVSLFWTLLGTTLAVVSGVAYCFYFAPARLESLPSSTQGQLILLGAIVSAGFLAQIAMGNKPTPEPKPDPAPKAEPAPA